MFRAFQVKKLVLCGIVAVVGVASADSIKCDSKEAIIAFATQACGLSPSEAYLLRENGVYSDMNGAEAEGEGNWSKHIVLNGKILTCVSPGEVADYAYTYSDFKTIKADKNKVKCRAKLRQMFEGAEYNHNVDFTLRNGLIAEDIECKTCI